jgi:hypothetical protein
MKSTKMHEYNLQEGGRIKQTWGEILHKINVGKNIREKKKTRDLRDPRTRDPGYPDDQTRASSNIRAPPEVDMNSALERSYGVTLNDNCVGIKDSIDHKDV